MKTESEMRAELVAKASTDDEFRSLLLSDPARAVSECLGFDVPASVKLHVHEEHENEHHLVLPGTRPMSDEQLQEILGGNSANIWGGPIKHFGSH